MMVTLGLSPISTVLAIGAGTMIFNHVNNSGFWVISRFFNLDLKQGLKYITLPDFVAGIFCFVMICGAAAVGLLRQSRKHFQSNKVCCLLIQRAADSVFHLTLFRIRRKG